MFVGCEVRRRMGIIIEAVVAQGAAAVVTDSQEACSGTC